MVFSSHIFLFYFLPFALGVYFIVPRRPQRIRNLVLALLGYAFYGWANPRFVVLMFATTGIDWLASLVIAHDSWRISSWWHTRPPALEAGTPRTRTQRTALLLSIVSNLAALGFFKYFNFAVDSYNALIEAMGLSPMTFHPILRVVLPLGISFYTFQSLSYIIDVYRGHARVMGNFIDFSCFVSMFPHLVAGPILRFSFLAGQIEQRRTTLEMFARGVALFSLGMGKKVLLANPSGYVADAVFGAGVASPLDAWYGAVAYAFQIYFDFSGYSDMAIGLGLMLGFVFAKNFDSPYKSVSLTDFWRRWHISLSSWLRDYLYVSLGGNRQGSVRTYRNLMLTMLLGGLWHGASWNFVIWGGIHGTGLAFERWSSNAVKLRLPPVVRIAVTFLVVTLAWVFFRSSTLVDAGHYLASMMGAGSPSPLQSMRVGDIYRPYYLLSLIVGAVVVWGGRQAWDITMRLTVPKAVAIVGVFWLALLMLFTQAYNPFIYYIF